MGRYAVIARLLGMEWYLGAIPNLEARELEVPLKFLGPGSGAAIRFRLAN